MNIDVNPLFLQKKGNIYGKIRKIHLLLRQNRKLKRSLVVNGSANRSRIKRIIS